MSEGHLYSSRWLPDEKRVVTHCTKHDVTVEDHVMIDRAVLQELWAEYQVHAKYPGMLHSRMLAFKAKVEHALQ